MGASPRLGHLLIDQGFITHDHLDFTLREQNATGERMGECLMRLGLITDSDLALVLAKQGKSPFIDMTGSGRDLPLVMSPLCLTVDGSHQSRLRYDPAR